MKGVVSMKMFKRRVTAVILTVLMLMTLVPAAAFAADVSVPVSTLGNTPPTSLRLTKSLRWVT